MPRPRFSYHTNCVSSTADRINVMVDQAQRITWPTFRKYVHWTEVRRIFPSYSYRCEHYNPETGEQTCGFHIKDDWAVAFYKSIYRGRLCVYIEHSAIEYIFLEQ